MSAIAENQKDQVLFDPKLQILTLPVLPGEHKIVSPKEYSETIAVQTLLGSCVAACIRDKKTGIGGLNHFLLPKETGTSDGLASARYGIHAMEMLINSILVGGVQKSDLEAKVFGGANVLQGISGTSIGEKNSRFVQEYLDTEKINVVASDLGGDRARKVYFIPKTGQVLVQNLSPSSEKTALNLERSYSKTLPTKQPKGGVDLF